MVAHPVILSPALRRLFLGEKGKNIAYFWLILLPNFLAALLEGLSFGLILLALAVLSEGKQLDVSHYPFLAGSWIERQIHLFTPKELFTWLIISAVGSQIFKSLLNYLGQCASTFLGTQIQTEAQKQVYRQILRLSFPCVSLYKVGDLVEYTKTPATVTHVILDALNRLIVSALAIAVSLGMMLLLSIPLTLLAVAIFGILGLFQKIVIHRISTASQFLSNYLVDFTKHTVQSLHGLRAIHAFDRQENVLRQIEDTLDKIAQSMKKQNLWNHSIVPINEMIGIVLVGIFLVIGQWLPGSSTSILPILLTFITIVYRLNGRVQVFLGGIAAIAGNWGQILRLETILDEKDKQFVESGGIQFQSFKSSIRFQNISLHYPSASEPSIRNLNLTIDKGATLAFVGASGAGKSSLIDLLLRLYTPTSGQLWVDDQNLLDLDVSSWRRQLGVVSQDSFIFNETIAENIRFGKLDATLDEIVHAAKTAGAHDFIARLPQQYDTPLGERGYRLSGGEKQRIALARALVRDPAILLLDEATSNLDSQSEKIIQKALELFHGKKTLIVVAHRLSTIVKADQIYVMDKGAIVESGTHESLLALNQRYASFWRLQSHLGASTQESFV